MSAILYQEALTLTPPMKLAYNIDRVVAANAKAAAARAKLARAEANRTFAQRWSWCL